jgi:cobyrinic acid a,c-diamide synthase
MTRGIIIAGTHSGVGKTTITVGLIAALRRLGLTVQPFKLGPDYIDPTYHTLSAGRRCRNLDTWLMPPERIGPLVASAACDVDFAVIEGVMGLFDGLGYEEETGSTAEIAKLLDLPVILVIDAAKMARSALAMVSGYQQFDSRVRFAGVIVNRVGSENHGRGVAAAIEKASGVPVIGWIPRDARLQIVERHLGLVPAVMASALEPGECSDFVSAAEEAILSHLNLDLLQRRAGGVSHLMASAPATEPAGPWNQGAHASRSARRVVIAVARDEAFHFTYEENLELLRAAGADIAFFSPLYDVSLPPGTAGIILSGGFPEMFAVQLAANTRMLEDIREAYRQQLPMYAECGGLMYLTEAIVDQQGRSHHMAGLLPGRSVMSGRLTLGYRRAEALASCWLFDAGEEVRGHEFHHSRWENRTADVPPAFLLRPARGDDKPWPEGARLGNLWASYLHLHFCGKPELATRFVKACHEATAVEKAGVP